MEEERQSSPNTAHQLAFAHLCALCPLLSNFLTHTKLTLHNQIHRDRHQQHNQQQARPKFCLLRPQSYRLASTHLSSPPPLHHPPTPPNAHTHTASSHEKTTRNVYYLYNQRRQCCSDCSCCCEIPILPPAATKETPALPPPLPRPPPPLPMHPSKHYC